VRLAVIDKLAWIKRQKSRFANQPRQSQREMVNGESHYFLGQRLRLRVIERQGRSGGSLRGRATLDLFVRPGGPVGQREAVLMRWYRDQLRELTTSLLQKWQVVLSVQITAWGIKKMKTKWGSCNTQAGRIWINLELVKKPPQCLEYIVVHELVHMLERNHTDRFTALMDQYLPDWRSRKALLNQAPLGHEVWDH
jgi:hypothetical protein